MRKQIFNYTKTKTQIITAQLIIKFVSSWCYSCVLRCELGAKSCLPIKFVSSCHYRCELGGKSCLPIKFVGSCRYRCECCELSSYKVCWRLPL